MEQQTLQQTKSEQPTKLSTHLLNVLKATIPGFVIDQDNEVELGLIGRYIDREHTESLDLNKGLMLIGNPGSGKTEILLAIQTVFRVTKHPLAFKFKPIWKIASDFGQSGFEAIDYFKNENWCFDELGLTERETVNYFGNKVNVAETIIHERYNSFKRGFLTHFSTNLSEDQINVLYDERITSRLKEMCNVITLAGTDRRINATGKNVLIEKQSEEIDEKKIQEILKVGALSKFATFKKDGYTDDPGNSTYDYLNELNLLPFSNVEKHRFMGKAIEVIKAEMQKEKAEAETTGDMKEAKKIHSLLAAFEKSRPYDQIKTQAKKIALNEYFKQLTESNTELTAIIQ